MGSPSSSQSSLSALQRRIVQSVDPASLRRLIRGTFPRIYAELIEQSSPEGLVDDLFRIASNHGETDAVIATLYAKWPGLRSARARPLPAQIPARGSPRIPALLLVLLLGPMEDVDPPREDLSVPAPFLSRDSPASLLPETVLPIVAPLPAPASRAPDAASLRWVRLPGHRPPPPLTSMTKLQSVLRHAVAPCAQTVGGGLYLNITVYSDDQGRWSHSAVDDFSRDLHRCLVRVLDQARVGRRDRFPSNAEARLVVIFSEDTAQDDS